MRINQLEYFAAVAKHLSFTKASEECHVAQPAISQQIQSLEKELGFTLLNRSTHGVSLTEAGQAYYLETAGVLETLDRSARKARAISRGSAGVLIVGITNSGQTGMLGVIEKFSSANPEIGITLRRSHSLNQCKQLLDHVFDITLTATACVAAYKEIKLAGTSTSRLRIAVSKNHPLAARKDLTTDDLRGFPHIIADHENDDLVRATYPYLENDPDTPIVRVEDQGIGLATMMLGLGIEALPESVVPSIQDGFVLCDVKDYNPSLETGWAYLADNPNPALAAFVQFAVSALDPFATSRYKSTI